MKFILKENNITFEFEFNQQIIDTPDPQLYLNIVYKNNINPNTSYKGWAHKIVNGKIKWYDSSFHYLNLTPTAIQYAEKLVKNMVFI